MTTKQVKNTNEKTIEFDFFEDYNNKVEVVGFKTSWVSEFEENMKKTYEDKSETSEKKQNK